MTTYKEIFNKYNDRRQQSLPFVGTDRRKIIEDAETQAVHETNNEIFLERASDLKGVKRIA